MNAQVRIVDSYHWIDSFNPISLLPQHNFPTDRGLVWLSSLELTRPYNMDNLHHGQMGMTEEDGG